MAFEKVSSYLNICTSCLLALTATFVVVLGQNEAPINLAVSTECSNYVIAFAGMYSREFYTCCPPPPTTGTESPCKQDPAILNFQCKEPDTRFSETKNVSKAFNCNGQIGQKNALNRCTSRWGWLEQDEKDPDCWAFSTCFGGACESEVEQIGSSLKGDFCGDGKCDEATEDGDSCPIDCCPYVNPDECQVVNNTCTDECCGQKLCCIYPKTGTSIGGAITSVLIWVIVGIAIFVVVINLCCCFCCVCCAKRCCKKHKKDKKRKSNEKNTPV